MKSIVHTFLILFVISSIFIIKTNASLQCMANDMGTGPYDKPCIFPFRYENETITECTSLYISDNFTGSWCATDVDTNGTFDQWGICNCTVITPVPSVEPVPSVVPVPSVPVPSVPVPSVPVPSVPPVCGDRYVNEPSNSVKVNGIDPKIECNWDVKYSESYLSGLRNPSMIIYFQDINLDIGDSAIISSVNSDNTTQVLLSTKQELLHPENAHFGVWTLNPNVSIHLKSDLGGENKGFILNFFIGFCSDYNGEMLLPKFALNFHQNFFLISDNNNPITGSNTTYRPNSDCLWSLPSNPQREMLTLNFYRFNLSDGDVVHVLCRTNNYRLYSFDRDHPPEPIYTSSDEGLFVNFLSDDRDEGFGFDANLLRGRCDSRLVPLFASMATVTDGSSPFSKYQPGLSCSWLINPWEDFLHGGYIQIRFNYLTLGNLDVLIMYEGDSEAATKLGRWQGTKLTPNDTVISTSGKVYITFTTDEDQIGLPLNVTTGFSFTYKVCTGKCLDCKPGTYYNITKNECKTCPMNTISNSSAQLECQFCAAGSEWKTSEQCNICSKGHYSSDGIKCNPCPAGLIAPQDGMANCTKCPKENYYAVNGTDCEECPPGTTPSINTCVTIPVPERPVNNEAVLIYLLVGLAIIVIGISAFAFYKKKQDGGYQSVFTQPW